MSVLWSAGEQISEGLNMNIEDELKNLTPSEKQVGRMVAYSLIRDAISTLPRPIKWMGAILVVAAAVYFGKS